MIREARADRTTEADIQRVQAKAFEDWCRVGDPKEVAHARAVRRREHEVAKKAAAWLRDKRRAKRRAAA